MRRKSLPAKHNASIHQIIDREKKYALKKVIVVIIKNIMPKFLVLLWELKPVMKWG
jgi:hypothetical protein